MIPESFHFLVSRGKTEKLKKWIRTANRYARHPKDEKCAERLVELHSTAGKVEDDEVPKNEFLRELLQRKKLLVFTIIIAYTWTTDSFIYYGLSLISTSLSGDKYLNFALSGLVEIPSYLITPFCLEKFGRRCFVSFTHALTMIAFLGVIFIGEFLGGKFFCGRIQVNLVLPYFC
jgi:OCT family organic cation transporter-like MFS transporter 4/5